MEIENIDFVKVTADNVDLVQPLAQSIWEVTYKDIITAEQIDYMLNRMYSVQKIKEEIANGYVWELAVVDQRIIGYLDYVLQADARVFLSKIYLNPQVQSRGFGLEFLNRVVNYTKAANGKSIYLTVNKNNVKAISFYKRNGFKQIGVERFDIGAGYIMDDYIMQLDV
ncbi:GNAT family N-acetyltransferase [Flavobacterium sp. NKUCC04_CG]|uniref:GNAT family N-acetyltransferase n=1 Tax=Flavobacterium sp. NKUCC04_CG TaxID=2842121 RepID=UPI001C5A973A|nr:GNAT family N-acetyltransferase [Flavobacterium sp. NKUCC04_CG]MBW3519469.1 GNAT family N-acetyltransferase [Flavobacterium sp. NKUCC04_CG]